MTRRRVIFIDANRTQYVTPEFNGDKSEFKAFGSMDSCDANWEDVSGLFRECKIYSDFVRANVSAQSLYHSCLPGAAILPCHKLRKNEALPMADEYLYVGPGAKDTIAE